MAGGAGCNGSVLANGHLHGMAALLPVAALAMHARALSRLVAAKAACGVGC